MGTTKYQKDEWLKLFLQDLPQYSADHPGKMLQNVCDCRDKSRETQLKYFEQGTLSYRASGERKCTSKTHGAVLLVQCIEEKLNHIKYGIYDEERDCLQQYKRMVKGDLGAMAWRENERETGTAKVTARIKCFE